MPIFHERTRDREPSGRFGVDVADFTRTYVLEEPLPDGGGQPVKSQDLYDRINLIIGGTLPGPSPRPLGSPGGAGSVDRRMPMADPQFPGLFADVAAVRIVNMEGYSQDSYGLGPLLAVPPGGAPAGFPLWKGYEIDVTSTARPYAVVGNERMVPDFVDFYAEDGTRRRGIFYPCHLRYVQTLTDDLDSRISASQGNSMVFRVPSGSPPGADGSAFPGIPDMVVPDQKVILRWYQVPLRYLTSANSYLVRYKGYVNQLPFYDKPPGAWLYMGTKSVKVYTPPQFLPTQQPATIDGFTNVLTGSFYEQPLCDLELTFYRTTRTLAAADVPPSNEVPNKNWIASGGFNLLPHLHSKRFFYGHALTVPANDYARWVPYYLSVPHILLFQDPDVEGVVTVI